MNDVETVGSFLRRNDFRLIIVRVLFDLKGPVVIVKLII